MKDGRGKEKTRIAGTFDPGFISRYRAKSRSLYIASTHCCTFGRGKRTLDGHRRGSQLLLFQRLVNTSKTKQTAQ